MFCLVLVQLDERLTHSLWVGNSTENTDGLHCDFCFILEKVHHIYSSLYIIIKYSWLLYVDASYAVLPLFLCRIFVYDIKSSLANPGITPAKLSDKVHLVFAE